MLSYSPLYYGLCSEGVVIIILIFLKASFTVKNALVLTQRTHLILEQCLPQLMFVVKEEAHGLNLIHQRLLHNN